MLQETLDEEQAADEKLTKLAERFANEETLRGESEGGNEDEDRSHGSKEEENEEE